MKREEYFQAALFDTFEEELTGQELEFDHQQQSLHCRWRCAKTVLELLTQGLQGCWLHGASTAAVDFQTLRLTVYIRLREVALYLQAEFRFNTRQDVFPAHRADGLLQHLKVQIEPHTGNVS